jgi:hypothetical protein
VPPVLVTFVVWGVTTGRVPSALFRMAADRRHLRGVPGLRFAKLLGTGSGRTFTPRDADPRHWGLLAAWDSDHAADAFEAGPAHRHWERLAAERFSVRMRPLSSRGAWARQRPFGDPTPRPVAGPVAAITRARIRPTAARRFWRAVPPVSADLRETPGLLLAFGIGEAPIGLQGTFSLWDGADALVSFAHRRPAHAAVARRTPAEGWYTEELFARLEVLACGGTLAGRQPLLWPPVRPSGGPAQDPA